MSIANALGLTKRLNTGNIDILKRYGIEVSQ